VETHGPLVARSLAKPRSGGTAEVRRCAAASKDRFGIGGLTPTAKRFAAARRFDVGFSSTVPVEKALRLYT
jgi:hypothetical protein